ncbi:MAG: hypothetical protein ACM36C_08710 [Acidobacteriota bacterium]
MALTYEGHAQHSIAAEWFAKLSPEATLSLTLVNREFLQPATTLTVITNFFDDLKRRTPAHGR